MLKCVFPMVPSMVSLLRLVLGLLMCFCGAVRTKEKNMKTRDLTLSSTFHHQLLDNVVSSCHKLLVEKPTLTSAADGIIEVIPSAPSNTEQTTYERLPTTKTRANAALAKGEVLGESKVESWRKSDNNWQLPRDHIRNDKDRCVNASIASSQRTTLLYQEMKQDTSSFYLLHTHHALIHPTGIILKQCGYIQPHEACETIFRFLGRNWFRQCQGKIKEKSKSASKSTAGDGKDSGSDSSVTREWSWESVWDGSDSSIAALHHACRDISEDGKKMGTNTKKKWQGDPATLTLSLAVSPISNAHHRRVFVISAGWDANYHHFLLDSLTRLVRHLDFLHANPDIKIHIRATENHFRKVRLVEGGRKMRARLFAMLGLDLKRVITGMVYADEVYIPKGTRCNAPLTIAYDLRLLVNLLMAKSFPEAWSVPRLGRGQRSAASKPRLGVASGPGLGSDSFPFGDRGFVMKAIAANHSLATLYTKKQVVILHRPCYTIEECDKGWREWDNVTVNALSFSLQSRFPSHDVVILGQEWQDCLSCQIRLFAHTDVLVATHGAGITNMVFMPPQGVVVEIVAGFDGRMLPLCGYHGPLAASFGLHHYVYYYDWKQNAVERKQRELQTGKRQVVIDTEAIAHQALEFYQEIKPFG